MWDAHYKAGLHTIWKTQFSETVFNENGYLCNKESDETAKYIGRKPHQSQSFVGLGMQDGQMSAESIKLLLSRHFQPMCADFGTKPNLARTFSAHEGVY